MVRQLNDSDDAGDDDDCLSEQIVSSMNRVQLHDEDGNSDNEESESEKEETETKTKTAAYEPLWSADTDSSDISDEEELYDEVDISRDQQCVQPPPLFGGFMLVPVRADEEEFFEDHSRMNANRALGVYNSEMGSDYEYVSCRGLRPIRSLDDSDGHHMNFWAKTKGTDDDPELFFSSSVLYDDDDTDEIHCCKLDSFDDEAGIIHCEHVDCSDCALWVTS